MSDFEKLFSQIKQLATVVTDENYNEYSKRGYDILMRIHDSGMTQNQVYSIFSILQQVRRWIIKRLVCRDVRLYMWVV